MATNLTPLEKVQKSIQIRRELEKKIGEIRNKVIALEEDLQKFNFKYKSVIDAIKQNKQIGKDYIAIKEKEISALIEKSDNEILDVFVDATIDVTIDSILQDNRKFGVASQN